MNLTDFQTEVTEWSNYNFGENQGLEGSINPLLGVMEELGELVHTILKTRQNIRMNEDHEANGKDAVGDLMVYLADFCQRKGWSLDECVTLTWEKVKQRNWRFNPTNGVVK